MQTLPPILHPAPLIMNWSGGKDSSLAVQAALANPDVQVEALLTTIAADRNSVAIHEIPLSLIAKQAEAIGLPLEIVKIPTAFQGYDEAMRTALEKYKVQGVKLCGFGDLFLEDIKEYRDQRMKEVGMEAYYPLWKLDTRELAHYFIGQGFKAILTCVDSSQIDPKFCGRMYDKKLLAELPARADPCGENGEFHTLVFDGPIFRRPVEFNAGAMYQQDRFYHLALVG